MELVIDILEPCRLVIIGEVKIMEIPNSKTSIINNKDLELAKKCAEDMKDIFNGTVNTKQQNIYEVVEDSLKHGKTLKSLILDRVQECYPDYDIKYIERVCRKMPSINRERGVWSLKETV